MNEVVTSVLRQSSNNQNMQFEPLPGFENDDDEPSFQQDSSMNTTKSNAIETGASGSE